MITTSDKPVEVFSAGSFEPVNHFYPKVLNAAIHPIVSYFFNLTQERLISRYLHLHPNVDRAGLETILNYQPRYVPWGGGDLFYVTTEDGIRKMVLIEINSSPSGQKSMPLIYEHVEEGGYRELLSKGFLRYLKGKRLPSGALAVLYDKNYMESSGYAATLAELTGEQVYLVPYFHGAADPPARFDNGVLYIRPKAGGDWVPVRAAFRYVTQKPWQRIPITTKTVIFNPILACLAGGRNKMLADRAYELFNSEFHHSGLKINVPETKGDLTKGEIPLQVRQFGGHAVIKVPYSNAGQGVFTITSEKELDEFMGMKFDYRRYIVQSLIGNRRWSSISSEGQFYHVGTIPNKWNNIFVADLRLMVMATAQGFRPLAIYGRRARDPLLDELSGDTDSWNMLGTNLSIKMDAGGWDSDTKRLLLMDYRDFNILGIGMDDIIEGFIQTVMGVVAIDKFARDLMNQKGSFRVKLFQSINDDPELWQEMQEAAV